MGLGPKVEKRACFLSLSEASMYPVMREREREMERGEQRSERLV